MQEWKIPSYRKNCNPTCGWLELIVEAAAHGQPESDEPQATLEKH